MDCMGGLAVNLGADTIRLPFRPGRTWHLDGVEIPLAEVVRGRAAYHKHFLPNMWEANLRRLRSSDPDLFEFLDDA